MSLKRLPFSRAAGIVASTLLIAVTASCAPSAQQPGSGQDDASFPMELTTPYGSSTLEAKPTRVATVTNMDLDLVLSMGISPVVTAYYEGFEDGEFPWTKAKMQELGAEPASYPSTGAEPSNFEAIAAAKPDVIIAVYSWQVADEYEKLATIAPVVAVPTEEEMETWGWQERLELVGKALGETEKASSVIQESKTAFERATTEHPGLKGKSYTYAIVYPDRISYASPKGKSLNFFDSLGMTQPEFASEFSFENDEVSRENLAQLDADVLLISYPYLEEGSVGQKELEADPLFKQIPAVQSGHYLAVEEQADFALAYPNPLADAWLLENFVPDMAKAAGE